MWEVLGYLGWGIALALAFVLAMFIRAATAIDEEDDTKLSEYREFVTSYLAHHRSKRLREQAKKLLEEQ